MQTAGLAETLSTTITACMTDLGLTRYQLRKELHLRGLQLSAYQTSRLLRGAWLPRRRWDTLFITLADILQLPHPAALLGLPTPPATLRSQGHPWPAPFLLALGAHPIPRLAAHLNIPLPTIYHWTSYSIPPIPTLIRIADLLGVPPQELIPDALRERDQLRTSVHLRDRNNGTERTQHPPHAPEEPPGRNLPTPSEDNIP